MESAGAGGGSWFIFRLLWITCCASLLAAGKLVSGSKLLFIIHIVFCILQGLY